MSHLSKLLSLCLAIGFIGCSASEEVADEDLDDLGAADTWDDEGTGNVIAIIGVEDELVRYEYGSGQTFEVIEGPNIFVMLPSNPSTGYSWEVISTDRTFGYPVSDEFMMNEDGPIGSGGFQVMTWETGGALSMVGSHTVVLGYKRSWEEGDPETTFTFTVDIVAGDLEPEPEPEPEPGDEPVMIDDSGDGGTFEVIEGQDVVVQLPANPTTGYSWVVVETDRTFGYPASDEFLTDEDGPIGSGGYQELIWVTGGVLPMAGSHTVVLGYKRPWEEGDPEETFTFTVNITAE